jgi:hypothetical protein
MSKTSRVAAGTAVIAALGVSGVFTASAATAAPTPSPAPSATSTTGSPARTSSGSTDPNLYPFGAPSGGVAVKVPPPPGQPTLSPTYTTKTTTRIYGANPYEEAISVTQHI